MVTGTEGSLTLKNLTKTVWVAAVSMLLPAPAIAQPFTLPDVPQVQVVRSNAGADTTIAVMHRTQAAIQTISRFWGVPYRRQVRLVIDDHFTADFSAAGEAKIYLRRRSVLAGQAPIEHEVTHLILGSHPRPMLQEGVAVYFARRFKPGGARPLPAQARKIVQETSLDSLKKTAQEIDAATRAFRRKKGRAAEAGQRLSDAYSLSGAFVQYLIETHGLAKFKFLYAANNYRIVYGTSRDDLERDWLIKLSTLR